MPYRGSVRPLTPPPPRPPPQVCAPSNKAVQVVLQGFLAKSPACSDGTPAVKAVYVGVEDRLPPAEGNGPLLDVFVYTFAARVAEKVAQIGSAVQTWRGPQKRYLEVPLRLQGRWMARLCGVQGRP